MSAAICGHSLLMALLSGYDKALIFPPKYSSNKLELRGKLTRLPNAWAPEDEEETAEGMGTKLHGCPVAL